MVSVVLPCFNEKGNIESLVRDLDSILVSSGERYEIIFSDDGSTDGTPEEILRQQKQFPRLKLVRVSSRQGKTAALRLGFQQSIGETIVAMDADRQYDPADIPRLLEVLRGGCDVVSGWRLHRKDSPARLLQSRCFHAAARLLLGMKFQDMNSGLKIYRRPVLEALKWEGQAHRYALFLSLRRGFRVTEVPVAHRERKWGGSKYGWCRLPSVLVELCQLRLLGGCGNFNR